MGGRIVSTKSLRCERFRQVTQRVLTPALEQLHVEIKWISRAAFTVLFLCRLFKSLSSIVCWWYLFTVSHSAQTSSFADVNGSSFHLTHQHVKMQTGCRSEVLKCGGDYSLMFLVSQLSDCRHTQAHIYYLVTAPSAAAGVPIILRHWHRYRERCGLAGWFSASQQHMTVRGRNISPCHHFQ